MADLDARRVALLSAHEMALRAARGAALALRSLKDIVSQDKVAFTHVL